MQKQFLFAAAMAVPLSGLALMASRVTAAEPADNPPKAVAPKDAKPEAAPKDAPPKEAAPKDAAPAKAPDPKDAAPRAPDAREPMPPAADKAPRTDNPPRTTDPRDPRPAPRETTPPARDNIPNARDPRNPRDTIPNARDPNVREPMPNTRENVRDPKEVARDPRDTTRGPMPQARDADRDSRTTTRDATRDTRTTTRETARDAHREHRSTRELGVTFGEFSDRGLAVNAVASTSVLYRAGFRTGDVIVSVNGHRLERADDFDRFVYAVDNNERIKVVVLREGRPEVVLLEPTIFYVADESYDEDIANFGVVFDTRYPDRLIVRRIYADSPAVVAGLKVGDEIVSWHGQRIASAKEFGTMLHNSNTAVVDFEFARGSNTVRAEAKLDQRVAAKPAEGTDTTPDNRLPPANPGPQPPRGPLPTPAPSPGPPSGTPAVTPPGPATPAPMPLPPDQRAPVRRLIRDR